MLSEALGLRWNLKLVSPERDTVCRLHWSVDDWREHPEVHSCRRVLGIRDPRDTLVSMYYMLCRAEKQHTVHNLSMMDYIEEWLLRLREPRGKVGGLPHCSWPEFYRQWIEAGADIQVRHEDTLENPGVSLRRWVRRLNLPLIGKVDTIVAKYADYKRATYDVAYTERRESPPGLPRGRSRWRAHLGQAEQDAIRSACGDIMDAYEYE